MKLIMVPFQSVAEKLPREIARRLRAVLPWKLVVHSPVPDPTPHTAAAAIEAEAALVRLSPTGRHDELTVGIAGIDLCAAGLEYVFGYAAPQRGIAVVSLFRLQQGTVGCSGGRRVLIERASKEVLHETGHLMGLGHCDQPQCVMHYSQALQDTDRKDCGFCSRCLKELSRLPEVSAER